MNVSCMADKLKVTLKFTQSTDIMSDLRLLCSECSCYNIYHISSYKLWHLSRFPIETAVMLFIGCCLWAPSLHSSLISLQANLNESYKFYE